MRALFALAMSLVCLVLAASSAVSLGAQAPAAAQAVVPASPWAEDEQDAKPWLDRFAEYEDYLRTARIVREEDTEIGITEPIHAYFEPGGLADGAVIKELPTSRKSGYLESYLSEIAAYEMDKLLGLGMVPPTVERRHNGRPASAQLWVDDTAFLTEVEAAGERAPNTLGWLKQMRRWRVFHNLVANIDANQGNLLVVQNPNWHMILIDHSRAFTDNRRMIFDMQFIDRPFFERLKALDEETIEATVGDWLVAGAGSILRRRDTIVEHFEDLAAEKGDAAIFSQ